ncbi:hypothetical protein NDU88_002489 [Pleurodeles waltl]|uniref:PiggyBac transposable element-derived protein domain-containing protein n=1 Tax=Pleurodeles waltl TaxID=8319 RepID=A0AAV7WLD2_PLEWA|nr:hypothetical protein NDU88_002489 [Pleurodeles waltl]
MSGLHGMRDCSLDTDDNFSYCDELEDEADEYVFDPLEIFEIDFLDEDLDHPSSSKAIKDPLGVEMSNPTRNTHRRGSDWWLIDHVTYFITFSIRKSFNKETMDLMRAECPRPFLENKSGITPIVDPELMTFLLSPEKILGKIFSTALGNAKTDY